MDRHTLVLWFHGAERAVPVRWDMCGRYASARKRLELLEEFEGQADHAGDPLELEPDYNVAPTKRVYGVLMRQERDDQGDGGGADGGDLPVTRQLRVLRWGLVPSWAKDLSLGSKLINARAETLAVKPSFRRAFAKRRCLLPADGFYEWQTVPTTGGRVRKQPFFMCRRDEGVLAMAGLYELWRVPDVPDGQPDSWLWTATIITTQATDEFGHLHDRMPMVVERDNWAQWLDPARTGSDGLADLMVPAGSVGLEVRPVSPAVNNVRNNGPGLIKPAPPGEDPTEVPSAPF